MRSLLAGLLLVAACSDGGREPPPPPPPPAAALFVTCASARGDTIVARAVAVSVAIEARTVVYSDAKGIADTVALKPDIACTVVVAR